MLLKNIFEKPVDRSIEGVIKADDETGLLQEVSEYVLTNVVEKRLERFLDAYNNYSGSNGVWISGFFGSGKSHLLKILAFLLENRSLNGAPILEYFLPKCKDNGILLAELKRAVAIPSKSILFNIDQKAEIISKSQVDALLSVFVKVFDEMCGYYGKQGYIAQFERDLDNRGLFEAFKKTYQDVSGQPWQRGREVVLLEDDNIAEAYSRISDTGVSAAKGILDRYRHDYKLSIEDFANQINEYISHQGPNFRLNFFVDEVGQYIADNTKLMTNLQTIAESLATKCKGRAWVIVTAQEDMNAVVGEMSKQQGNDFSKIQDRFATRMKLTSADVAEVIQKRLLSKNEEGSRQLAQIYQEQVNNFKTLFDFAEGSLSYQNFRDQEHFVYSYPFIPYQVTLFQIAIQNLSQHNAFEGKHSSVGERSMLGVFQQVAVRIADKRVGELATFDLMFEGIRTALKAQIQSAILVAERNLGDDFAVSLLKALFLVKYVKSFKATARNLSILMMDHFERNVAELQQQVVAALDLLELQSYIQRNGELYEFLTDEEKDIEEEIKNTDVENSEIKKILEQIIFDDILKYKKIRFEQNGQDYSFSRKLDGNLCGREHELAINVISPFNELIDNETVLTMQSMGKAELLVIMPADNRFYQDLILYKKTDTYIRLTITQTQQEVVKRILTDKQFQNRERLSELQSKAKELLGRAKLVYNLKEVEIGTSDAQSRLMMGFQDLIQRTYPNLIMLRDVKYTEQDVGSYLKPGAASLFHDEKMLSEAEHEMLSFIQGNDRNGIRTTLKGLVDHFEKKPYGWYLAAILCLTAKLWAREKIEIRQDSNILESGHLAKLLGNTQAQVNLIITPQIDFTASQIRRLKDFYGHFFDSPPKSGEAKSLALETQAVLSEKLESIRKLAAFRDQYPFLSILDASMDQLQSLAKKEYAYFLTDFPALSDQLLEAKEDILDPVFKFMNGSARAIYDEGVRCLTEHGANVSDQQTQAAKTIKDTISDPLCFKGNKMQSLKSTIQALQDAVEQELAEVRAEALADIEYMQKNLIEAEGYDRLSSDQQRGLTDEVAKLSEIVNQHRIIAVIREQIRHFKENHFLQLLDKRDRLIQAAMQPDKPPYEKPDKQGGGTTAEKTERYKPKYINKSNIKVQYNLKMIATPEELDDYVAALKAAFLEEIKNGRKIQIS